LLRQKLAEMNCLQSEIDALRAATGTPQQILIKLQILEVSRTKLRNLPIDFPAITDGRVTNEQANALFNRGEGSFEFSTFEDSVAVEQIVEWMVQNNVARKISSPHIVTTSGRPASFKTGREVPVATGAAASKPLELRHVGTEVDVLAISQGESRVRIELRTRVSDLDDTRPSETAVKQAPFISVRQLHTAVEMGLGETTALSGMVQERVETTKTNSGIATRVNEVELLVLVTPEAQTARAPGEGQSGEPYHTATSEASPAERSLRVSKPFPPR
jgi:pilus assembly protein CpaC